MKHNLKNSLDRLDRMVRWIATGFGLILFAFGGLISLADGGKDLGGVVGGVFMFGGLSLAILAVPDLWRRKK